jgi:4-hydroxybenzoate polyprenyltransferase
MTNYLGVEFAKIIRLKSLGMSMVPVIGALSVHGDLSFYDFIVLFFIGILINAVGFMLNDLIDIKRDSESSDFSERPLVKGILPTIFVKKLIVLFIVVALLSATLYFQNLFALLVLMLGSGFGILYDIYSKKIYGVDIFLAAAFALFCLFGMLTQTSRLFNFNIILLLLVFFQILYFNIIEGGLKDAYADSSTKAKTLAVKFGVGTIPEVRIPLKFRLVALGLEGIVFILTISPFLFIPNIYQFEFWFISLGFIVAIGVSYAITMFKMLTINIFQRDNLRFMIGAQELKRYLNYLGILSLIAGFLWPIILIGVPILWALVWMFLFKILYHQPLPRTSKLL